jgi:hypothetical protein
LGPTHQREEAGGLRWKEGFELGAIEPFPVDGYGSIRSHPDLPNGILGTSRRKHEIPFDPSEQKALGKRFDLWR